MFRTLFICTFFFNDTATTEIYTLSLHDALPISLVRIALRKGTSPEFRRALSSSIHRAMVETIKIPEQDKRSEEHTSELQSHVNLVCRLLLEKKNIKYTTYNFHCVS